MFTATALCRRLCCTASLLRASAGVGSRLHGTVTGFKHRRGYGFILAEGTVGSVSPNVDVSSLMTSYFFTRNSLLGGFYITEGERVAFDVEERHRRGRKEHAATAAYVPLEGEAALLDSVDPETVAATEKGDATEKALNLAVNIQMFDAKRKVESPVEPIALRGKLIRWDAATGSGVIGELDTEGRYHADAPKFAVSLDDTDLNSGVSLRVGRYVRFCLEKEDDKDGAGATAAAQELPVARRVILDYSMERRMAVVGRPLAPAGAKAGTVTASTRFEGVVKELNGQFGFIKDDLSNESIFFHVSNVAGKGVAPGERVTYLLRELTTGKHTGKKACFNVLRAGPRQPSSVAVADDDDDIDVFDVADDEDEDGWGATDEGRRSSSSSSTRSAGTPNRPSSRVAPLTGGTSGKKPRQGKRRNSDDADGADDFDLLL